MQRQRSNGVVLSEGGPIRCCAVAEKKRSVYMSTERSVFDTRADPRELRTHAVTHANFEGF
jgi:hypothetical protein